VGEAGEGVVITQVVPPPSRTSLPAVAAYRKALAQYFPDPEPNFVSLEAYISARVLATALERAGRGVTRASLISTIEGMKGVDIGVGSDLAYTAAFHQAFGEVFPTVLRGGEAVVFSDWKEILPTPASR
jgi:ABC-type branched-subunit amino acid transport system substrate-binding protein